MTPTAAPRAGVADPPGAHANLDPAAIMAKASRENFPVASRLLPRAQRSHLLALYGFARLVDDIGDEAPGDRLARLDALDDDLRRVWDGVPCHPLLARLQPTVRACSLPIEPFQRLIEANRRDQRQSRYETYEELVGYCALSANPVGELVLRVFGLATQERVRLSDDVCTALQLTEHWQDVAEDRARGRVYLPAEDLARFGVGEDQLYPGLGGPGFRALMAFEVDRARALLDRGARLVATLRGRPRLAVAGFVAGGRAALAAIERGGYDVLGGRPRPGAALRASALIATLASGGRSR